MKMFLQKNSLSSIFIEKLWLFLRASWSQYLSDISLPHLLAPYCKAVPENSFGFQALLSANDYTYVL